MKKNQIVTDKDNTGKDEWWCCWYRCKNCGKASINRGFIFCPNCGVKLVWRIKIEDTI